MFERNLRRYLPIYISILALLTILLSVSPSHAWDGKCVGVADGDTITVMHNGKGERIRLYGIDTPEMGQDFGKRAKQFTSGMVFGEVVTIEQMDTDRYGRTVAMVYVGDQCINEEVIRNGFAWVYTKYCKEGFCRDWYKLEEEARISQVGLWAHTEAIPPWEFRRIKNRSEAIDGALKLASGGYHGNRKSHVFHRPGCRYYNCKNCTVVFSSREEAINSGFRPCKVCKP